MATRLKNSRRSWARSTQRSGTSPGVPRRIAIVALPPVRPLDLMGPAEVFGEADRLRSDTPGHSPAYSVEIISAGSEPWVGTHIRTSILGDRTYLECSEPFDTILVAGGDGAQRSEIDPRFLDWLKTYCLSARRFGSVCTGALILAKAGLLNGRRVTTHWNWCAELTRDYPGVTVDPDPIFIKDGNCYTSAGVTAGIDLSLALVEEDLGSALALRIAQMLVVFLRRPGNQSQFSRTLAAQATATPVLNDLLAWLADNLRRNLSVATLAKRSAMSERNFARLFTQIVGTTPGRHVEELRLEAARRQLETGSSSLGEVAAASGFGSAEVLRRTFLRRLGVTPGRYRRSFGIATT